MVFLVIIQRIPLHQVLEMAKLGVEKQKEFDWGKYGEVVDTNSPPGLYQPDEDGLKGIFIKEVKEGKLEDAMKLELEWAALFSNIKGFRTKLEVFYGTEELAAIARVQIPK
ncbi:MAG: hypothetical protein ACFFCS_21045 [Candidatus Hodarchaeota archaeon]